MKTFEEFYKTYSEKVYPRATPKTPHFLNSTEVKAIDKAFEQPVRHVIDESGLHLYLGWESTYRETPTDIFHNFFEQQSHRSLEKLQEAAQRRAQAQAVLRSAVETLETFFLNCHWDEEGFDFGDLTCFLWSRVESLKLHYASRNHHFQKAFKRFQKNT